MNFFYSIIILFALVAGCKKYPEDDKFHLSTVKCRLTKEWNPTDIYNYINNNTLYYSDYSVIWFSKNGDFHGFEITYLWFDGTWELIDNKNKIKITDNNGVGSEYIIMKLDNNDLWFQNDSLLYRFTKQGKKR